MFTYLDPTVRARLVEQGKLIRIAADGQTLDPDASPPAYAINILGPIPMPMDLGGEITVEWYATVRSTELKQVESLASELRAEDRQQRFATLSSSMAVNSVLKIGQPQDNPLVRVHSSCLTGDVFGSQRCECGPQLQAAVQRISKDPGGGGYLVYMAGHEGRGIGLWAKAATYLLQDAGEDTYQANRLLGLPDDSRDFTDAAALLHHFVGNRPFRLLTNNPKKVIDLQQMGLDHITRVKHLCGVGDWNRRYLEAKQGWGHELDLDELD